MNLAVEHLEPVLRMVAAEPLSVEAFWRFSAEHPDLRMEREPNGDVIIMTPTTKRTGFRNAEISYALRHWAGQDGRGYALDSSTGFTLTDSSVRSPDAAWISAERWNPEDEDDYLGVLAPDFVIELRSKTDRVRTVQEKMLAWMSNGVQLGWLIDPQRRVVEIYRQGEAQATTLTAPDVVEGEAPVAGFLLKLESIWGKG
jgi:Uma2 family endonuclease